MKPYATKYMSATSQNEFANILAEDVRGRISNDISSAGIFSVMADTSPDTSNIDRLVQPRNTVFCAVTMFYVRDFVVLPVFL